MRVLRPTDQREARAAVAVTRSAGWADMTLWIKRQIDLGLRELLEARSPEQIHRLQGQISVLKDLEELHGEADQILTKFGG